MSIDRGSRNMQVLYRLLYYLGTHEKASMPSIIDDLQTFVYRRPDLGPKIHRMNVSSITVSRKVSLLRQTFAVRIVWSAKDGYQLVDWGIIDKEKFLKLMERRKSPRF